MTPRFSARTLSILLAAGISTSLSSCTYTKRQLDYFTNDRQPQYVEGGRRVPQLNPDPKSGFGMPPLPAQGNAAAPMPQADMQASNKPVPSYDESPYDYFDDAGNRVEPAELQRMPEPGAQAQKQPEGNFFARMFGSESSEVEQLRQAPRKPLVDNAYPPVTPSPSAANAPLEPPVVKLANEPFYPVEEGKPASAGTVPPVEVSGQREEQSWMDRRMADVKGAFAGDAKPTDTAAEDKSYPVLSSVPATPPAFADVKENKGRTMEELKADSAVAAQDRRALYSEPSGQEAKVPVPQTRAEHFEPSTALSEKELLLGHVSDSMAPVSTTSAPPPVAAAPAPAPVAAPVASEQPAAGKEDWWQEWNLFSSKRQNEEAVKEEKMPPAAEPTPMAAQPAPADVKPLIATPVEPATTTVPEATKVQEDAPKTADELMAESADEELPPTGMLREVKTLPPSRYIGRMRAN